MNEIKRVDYPEHDQYFYYTYFLNALSYEIGDANCLDQKYIDARYTFDQVWILNSLRQKYEMK